MPRPSFEKTARSLKRLGQKLAVWQIGRMRVVVPVACAFAKAGHGAFTLAPYLFIPRIFSSAFKICWYTSGLKLSVIEFLAS